MEQFSTKQADRQITYFPTTHWSAVLAAGDTVSAHSIEALNELCGAYWPPLYSYLRRAGHSPHDAQDLVQSFLARLIERQDLTRVAPEKGRFRTYLLVSLRNFRITQALRNKSIKRGAGQTLLPIDSKEAECSCGPDLNCPTPEAAYHRRWAQTVLERALLRLREEHIARGREALFEALSPFLDGAAADEYREVAVRLAMSRGAVGVAIHRLRLRMRELVRTEVAQTVSSPTELEAEMRHLLEAWNA